MDNQFAIQARPLTTEDQRLFCMNKCLTKKTQITRKDVPHTVMDCLERCTKKLVQFERIMVQMNLLHNFSSDS